MADIVYLLRCDVCGKVVGRSYVLFLDVIHRCDECDD